MQEKLSKLSELVKSEFNKEVIAEIKGLIEQIQSEFDSQRKESLAEFLEDPENKVEDFSPVPSDEEANFEELRRNYKDKRKAYTEQRAKEEKENLEAKLNIIDKINSITDAEENISKAFDIFNELKEKYNGIGRIPGDKHKEIQNSYFAAVDSFYYHIKIYRDLKEHDLHHNHEAKKELVKKLEVLSKAGVDNHEENVKQLQHEWYEIGPVPKDDYEALKEKFDAALEANYSIIKEKRAERKEQMLNNLEAKKKLLSDAQEISQLKPQNVKQWNKATDAILTIQKQWKEIGFGPKKENEEVWASFRAACDTFFDAKAEYFKDYKKELNINQQQKEDLCQQAEDLKDSTDWKDTAQKLINLQKKWKNIGPAPKGVEQKLWKRFRAACDAFFNAKEESAKKLEAGFEDNLKKKEELLMKFETLEIPQQKEEAIKALKSMLAEWSAVGRVPKSNLADITERFQTVLDAKMKAGGVEKEELEHSKFTARVQSALLDKDFERILAKEKRFLKEKIDEFKKQLIQYENNLGFFNNTSSKKNPLLEEAKKKISATNNAIEKMLDQMKYIDKSIRQKVKESVETTTEENTEA